MAESLKKMSFSSNKKDSGFDKEKERNLSENDPESSKLESQGNSNVFQVNKLFSGLKLSKDQVRSEEMDVSLVEELSKNSTEFGSKNHQFCLAGKIISILERLSTVLVQPSPIENKLLNIDTNLFISKSKSEIVDPGNWILLGQIEEIFGNVKNPVYAVRLSPENNFANVEDEVYFSSSHPSTSLFHIESGTNSKYQVIYHR